MPKVQIVVPISGSRDGQNWPAPGGFIVVPDEEAADLVRAGLARVVEQRPEPEKATVRKKPETRGGLRKDSLG